MTHVFLTLDSARWRLYIRVGDGFRYYDLGTTDYHTAHMIADEFRHGKYIDKVLLDEVRVEIKCPVHGWQNAPWGFCDLCEEDGIDALLDEATVTGQWLDAGMLNDDDLAGIDDLPF